MAPIKAVDDLKVSIRKGLFNVRENMRYKVKGKGLPQQAEVAQGVPGRLRPWTFLTFRHYKGGRSSAIHTDRLYPRRNPWYSLSEAESTSGHMVLSGEPRKKSPVTPPGIDPGTSRLVAQCLNHYATQWDTSIRRSGKSKHNNGRWQTLIFIYVKEKIWGIITKGRSPRVLISAEILLFLFRLS